MLTDLPSACRASFTETNQGDDLAVFLNRCCTASTAALRCSTRLGPPTPTSLEPAESASALYLQQCAQCGLAWLSSQERWTPDVGECGEAQRLQKGVTARGSSYFPLLGIFTRKSSQNHESALPYKKPASERCSTGLPLVLCLPFNPLGSRSHANGAPLGTPNFWR